MDENNELVEPIAELAQPLSWSSRPEDWRNDPDRAGHFLHVPSGAVYNFGNAGFRPDTPAVAVKPAKSKPPTMPSANDETPKTETA